MECKKEKFLINDFKVSVYAFSCMGNSKVENQDSFIIYHDDKQVVVAVADGLGSAAFSKEGSSKIVKIAVECLKDINSYNNLSYGIQKTWVASLDGNTSQYDTTLKFIKITNDKIVYGGIGDGWIVYLADKKIISLTSDSIFLNKTESILSSDLQGKFVIKEEMFTNSFSGLISTDGFSEDIDKGNAENMLNDFAAEVEKNEEDFVKEMYGTMVDWPVKTNMDDKTVIFIKMSKVRG